MSLKDEERVVWDPIEDVVADERATQGGFINLLLMLRDDS